MLPWIVESFVGRVTSLRILLYGPPDRVAHSFLGDRPIEVVSVP